MKRAGSFALLTTLLVLAACAPALVATIAATAPGSWLATVSTTDRAAYDVRLNITSVGGTISTTDERCAAAADVLVCDLATLPPGTTVSIAGVGSGVVSCIAFGRSTATAVLFDPAVSAPCRVTSAAP